jgi:hypothetical protein
MLPIPDRKKERVRYEMLNSASNLAGSCEHGNEPSGSIKGEEFLDYLSDQELLKKDSTQ